MVSKLAAYVTMIFLITSEKGRLANRLVNTKEIRAGESVARYLLR